MHKDCIYISSNYQIPLRLVTLCGTQVYFLSKWIGNIPEKEHQSKESSFFLLTLKEWVLSKQKRNYLQLLVFSILLLYGLFQHRYINNNFIKNQNWPWLVWLSGLSTGLRSKRSLVQFPVRAHAWGAGQVPDRGNMRGNHTLMFLSLSFSLPSPLSKNK